MSASLHTIGPKCELWYHVHWEPVGDSVVNAILALVLGGPFFDLISFSSTSPPAILLGFFRHRVPVFGMVSAFLFHWFCHLERLSYWLTLLSFVSPAGYIL